MKAPGIIRIAILSLSLGLVVLACAAQGRPSDGKDKDHPKQDSPHQQAKPEQQHEQQARPSTREAQPTAERPQQAKESPQRTQPQQRQASQQQHPTVSRQQEHARQQRTAAPALQSQGQQHVQQAAWQQHRVGNWQSDHRTWQQRGGYNGYRVPDDRFSLYFGSGHFFEIGNLPLLFVGGYPRFQYDGYWVTLLDPWPENWPPLWYEADNVYIDWGGDGYYLYDTNYPGIGIAVTISF